MQKNFTEKNYNLSTFIFVHRPPSGAFLVFGVDIHNTYNHKGISQKKREKKKLIETLKKT